MNWLRRNWLKIVFAFAILIVWEISVDNFIVPVPSEIISEFFSLLFKTRTWENVFLSSQRVYISLLFATLVGLFIGSLRYFYPKIAGYVDMIFYPSQFLASAVWTIIGIVLFGLSWVTPYFIIVMVILPNIFVAVQLGLSNINKQLLEYGSTITKNKKRIFRYIIFPQMMPPIFLGIIRSNAVAWKIVVTAELFIGTNGLGFMVNNYYRLLNIPKLFAVVLLIVLIGLVIDWILRYTQRRFFSYVKD
jgi:sulfonate transport system permease protein